MAKKKAKASVRAATSGPKPSAAQLKKFGLRHLGGNLYCISITGWCPTPTYDDFCPTPTTMTITFTWPMCPTPTPLTMTPWPIPRTPVVRGGAGVDLPSGGSLYGSEAYRQILGQVKAAPVKKRQSRRR